MSDGNAGRSAPSHLVVALADRYVIERELGRGGMATVYLARDLKHERPVALKLLDPELGAVLGAERFLSEIRVTANLQHPNLLPLFDSGSAAGLLYYVMPYVEGESLRARLDRERQLPVDEAVRIAVAIAGALDYAHAHGVVHRDLKPENILLQHGQPVVADFGIALAVSKAGGQRVTQTGLSLGTPQYMSPEQATGDRVIDGRTDIYSLGALTYEMIAGEPPHVGSTAQAIIARLMTEAPRRLATVRPTVPEHVDAAVRCALEKLPADRFATAREYADALGRRAHAPTASVGWTGQAVARPTWRMRAVALLPWALAAALALGLAMVLRRDATRPAPPTTRFVLDLPAGQRVALANGSSVTLSPDGRTIAYVASAPDAGQRIYVRRLDSLHARPLPGGEAGIAPIFSPDGREIAFRMRSDLRKVALAGGGPQILTPLAAWNGFAWARTGEILLAERGRIWRVGERGTRTALTTLDTARGEATHAAPWLLDDETIGFTVYRSTPDGARTDVGLVGRDGGPHALLDVDAETPLGYADGHLLATQARGSLVAYPVDLRARRVTGRPTVLLDSIVYIVVGGLQLNLARDGTLAYLEGSSGRRLALLDARGATIAETAESRDFADPAISPDGRRVAVVVTSGAKSGAGSIFSDLWIWDVGTNALTRLTIDRGFRAPAWTPDGNHILSLDYAGDVTEIWATPADGGTPPARVTSLRGLSAVSVQPVPPGRSVILRVLGGAATSGDIYQLDLATPGAVPVPIAHTRFREASPTVSPDGRWLAYTSDEAGRDEVFVLPLGGTGPRSRLALGTGSGPKWTSGGRIVYSVGEQTMVAALDLSAAPARVIRRDTLAIDGARLDVSPRTGRVLVAREGADWRIVVVTNWLAEARAKLRAR